MKKLKLEDLKRIKIHADLKGVSPFDLDNTNHLIQLLKVASKFTPAAKG